MKVKLLYIGRRTVDDKIAHVMLYRGKERLWSRLKRPIIGWVYPGELQKSGSISLNTRLQEDFGKDEKVTQDQLDEWHALDYAAESDSRKRGARAKLSSDKPLLKRFDDLRPLFSKMDFYQQDAFVHALLHYLRWGGKRKKRRRK